MSDMLDKLLQTEKSAAEMVSSAETEGNRRKSEARAEAQKRHAELLKEKAAQAENAVVAEKDRAVRERREKNEEYRAKLSAHPVDHEGFFRLIAQLIEKGGK
jgi:vacuolar-type H+-ATPase subunit H